MNAVPSRSAKYIRPVEALKPKMYPIYRVSSENKKNDEALTFPLYFMIFFPEDSWVALVFPKVRSF